MKFNQFLLKKLLTISLIFAGGANAAAVVNQDWGGYVATADSPVIGGAVIRDGCGANLFDSTQTCVRGFGIISHRGTATSATNIGNGTIMYVGYTFSCPINSARIDMYDGYIRADTGAVWDGVYTLQGWKYLGGGATSYVCVKTDTYQ